MEKEILIQLLELSGMNQKDFAEATNTPEPRISEWLKGRRNPKLTTLVEMAICLGYQINFSFSKN